MDKTLIEEKLINALKEVLGADYITKFQLNSAFDDTILHIVLSESFQALQFVCQIEDEFLIEFDDDDVDLEFFLSFKEISRLIEKYSNKETQ